MAVTRLRGPVIHMSTTIRRTRATYRKDASAHVADHVAHMTARPTPVSARPATTPAATRFDLSDGVGGVGGVALPISSPLHVQRERDGKTYTSYTSYTRRLVLAIASSLDFSHSGPLSTSHRVRRGPLEVA